MTIVKPNLLGLIAGFSLLTACTDDGGPVDGITAAAETVPVASLDDAADDPAIWLHPTNPEKSLILGTDKKSGLNIYRLDGSLQAFLPSGRLNNVDLRQNVAVSGFAGDLAAATNRSDDSITLFSIGAGASAEIGRFASLAPEPYGICTGLVQGAYTVFATHKTGAIIAYQVESPTTALETGRYKFASQLEGCVFDDETQILYVGEENKGIWRTALQGNQFKEPVLIDEVGSTTGLRADVEGLTLFHGENGGGYLVASSQGNNSYVLYSRDGANDFIVRFAVVGNDAQGEAHIDGTQETDGLEVTSAALGPEYPMGLLVVQDGANLPEGSAQNFKLIDWREVSKLIKASEK